MKIGQFTDTFLPIVDGVGRVVYSYADTLARKGHECYVVAPMADTGYQGRLPFELIEFVSFGIPTQRQYNSGIPQFDAHYEARISKIPLDIIHVHSPFIAGKEALRLGRKRNIPVIGMFHSRYYDDFYKLTRAEMLANIGVRYIISFYERCDEVWTVSQSSAETLSDYGYRGDVVVMPNGTPEVMPSASNLLLARETFHLPDRNLLLYCGQLNWKKNILCILEACAILKRGGQPFTLALVGQGPDTHAIERKVQELALGDCTIFTGHITQECLLFGLYEAASLFVFPSLYDTSGMVVREAAAMETPSVVVAGSAAAEPITDGMNGLLCMNSADHLAAVIKRALSAPDSLSVIGQQARKTIYLSWDRIIDQALVRYENLIGR
ncbi:MAG: glycosyltransferase [Clostridia bacterium]